VRIEVPHPDINPGFLSDWEMSRVVHVRLRRKGAVEDLSESAR
jgi:hypothetical protein